MDIVDSEAIGLLLQLLSGKGCTSILLLDFLAKEDLLALLSTSREIRTSILSNLHATNRLYFEAALQCDRSLLAGVYASDDVQRYEHRRLTALNEQERLDWAPQLRRLNHYLSALHSILATIIEPHEASTLIQDLRRVLREPDLPLPQLRHETVGTYCNSPFQVLLAQLDEPAPPL
ncbi:MAG: hypothetical protein JST59_00705 [Actinobacteria bacterium]|nr:hypothetical protein [Actinomycetota bacterium]